MSEYKGIKGFQVQTRSEDPSPTEVQTGDFYYNSSTGQFKTVNTGGAPLGTWSSGGNMNQARSQGGNNASGGSASIGLISGGNKYSPGASYTNTEIYDGTSWSEVNEINTSRGYSGGAGTPAGALVVSGITAGASYARAEVESFNGTS
jgi:hypothetical protein